MKWLGVIFMLMVNTIVAETMESTYEETKQTANSLHNNAATAVKNSKLAEVPGYQSSQPKETQLMSRGNLSDPALQTLNNNEAGQAIISSSETRERFVIDPKTDPLFKVFDQQTPENILNITDEPEGIAEDGVIKKTCEEGGEEITYECLENRHVVPQVPLKTATLTVNHLAFSPKHEPHKELFHRLLGIPGEQNGWALTLAKDITAFRSQFCPGFIARDIKTGATFNLDCTRIQNFKVNEGVVAETNTMIDVVVPSFVLVNINSFFWRVHQVRQPIPASLNITLYHDTYEGEAIDEWTGCDNFEQMVDEGLCQYGSRTLTQGAATRNINGYQIFKNEWQYRQIYHCKMIKDECDPLRAEGCYQVGSKCKERRQNKCWIYTQEYHCPNGKKRLGKVKSPAGAFCLTGNCHDASYLANTEMLDAIARLNVLKEVQNDIRANQNDVKIFKGTSYQCSRNCLSFKDCCGGMRGWGVSLRFTNCKPEEKQLAQMRQRNLCHQVGNTYCAKKVLGKCVAKKTSFCCFGTKFAKIIQEQGRQQLGIGWGEAKCPDCRALTVTELTRIDLSKINFSEVFADLMSKYKQPNIQALQERVSQRINDNLTNLTQSLSPQTGIVYDKKDGL
jgi:type-F conjugative transfer system mating-pair stabilization protein TraN